MIKAKKSLGQNFLIDQNIIDKIVNILDLKNRNILEIGPGTGNLTEGILRKNPKKVLVIEKDYNLANLLKEKFEDKIKVINKDILRVDENSLSDQTLTVFGNLPYNISTEILCKWILNLEQKIWFDSLILMFQKEVAERIISNFDNKSYGRLTILANWRLDIEKICDVSPLSFQPKPKIKSTVLFFKPKKKFFLLKNSKNLEKITRIFFMHRRKMIKKPYYQLFSTNRVPVSRVCDVLERRPYSEHVAVLCEGQIYILSVLSTDGVLSPEEILYELEWIRRDVRDITGDERQPSVGALTGLARNTWCEMRMELAEKEEPRLALEAIDSALFCVSMQLEEISEHRDAIWRHVRDRDLESRWYDKSMQLLVFGEGAAGFCFDHSAVDPEIAVSFAF